VRSRFWRERRGIAASDAVVDRFAKTERSPCILGEEDIRAAVAQQK
jgi:succinate dehydrogenase flavin-adding protein (antitoxin of CptAB toxin-antitoxin module)